ncbi:MAG: hypothetical protein AB1482_13175 [Pseudomonadota bacterium]
MKIAHQNARNLDKRVIKGFVVRHQQHIEIAANGASVLAAATGALAFAFEISPWLPAGISLAVLAVVLGLLHMEIAQRKELEKLLFDTARRDLAATFETLHKQAKAGGKTCPEALAAATATQRAVAYMLGHDTRELDTLLQDIIVQGQARERSGD